MNERDLEAEEAVPRPLVDQFGAFFSETCQLVTDVVDLERNVMHPRAALGEELSYGRLGPERRQQFDAPIADKHRGSLDPLVGDRFSVLELCAEEPLVGGDRLIEIFHGNAQVMD